MFNLLVIFLLLGAPVPLAAEDQSNKNIFPKGRSHVSIIATVEQTNPSHIVARAEGNPVSITLGSDAVVWKGREYHDFSPVDIGDEIMVSGRVKEGGDIVASKLWDNIVHLAGDITHVDTAALKIETVPSETHPKEEMTIDMDGDTQFSDSDRASLLVGREIDVIGFKTGKATAHASKITVYIGNRPAKLPSNSQILSPKP